MTSQITVEATINAPLAEPWHAWNTPDDITQWNAASNDWHTTSATVDPRVGGHYSSRMAAKDGSAGFDFAGTYTKITEHALIESEFGRRTLSVEFIPGAHGVTKRETFDPDSTYPLEQQKLCWQPF